MNHKLGWLTVMFSFVGQVGWAAGLVPDFQLTDVNSNSVRHLAPVSPRDYLLQVSGYYFGWSS